MIRAWASTRWLLSGGTGLSAPLGSPQGEPLFVSCVVLRGPGVHAAACCLTELYARLTRLSFDSSLGRGPQVPPRPAKVTDGPTSFVATSSEAEPTNPPCVALALGRKTSCHPSCR